MPLVWLEGWLTAYPGTLLMISHDREFLDAIIDRVLHIENRSVHAYSGNYSQFENARAEELAQQAVLHARQVRRIAEITSFVNRFRASATKSRQAQSRLKMLQRMERIVPAHVDSPFEFEFAQPLKTPRPLITLENAACGYAGTQVVSRINVSISPLDRIALLGPNGAGKSTLTKLLAGENTLLAGQRTAAADLSIGYFARSSGTASSRTAMHSGICAASAGLASRAARSKRCAITWENSDSPATEPSSPWGVFPAAKKPGLRSPFWLRGVPTCFCWMSRRITWTSRCARPSAWRCRASRAAWSWFRTIAT